MWVAILGAVVPERERRKERENMKKGITSQKAAHIKAVFGYTAVWFRNSPGQVVCLIMFAVCDARVSRPPNAFVGMRWRRVPGKCYSGDVDVRSCQRVASCGIRGKVSRYYRERAGIRPLRVRRIWAFVMVWAALHHAHHEPVCCWRARHRREPRSRKVEVERRGPVHMTDQSGVVWYGIALQYGHREFLLPHSGRTVGVRWRGGGGTQLHSSKAGGKRSEDHVCAAHEAVRVLFCQFGLEIGITFLLEFIYGAGNHTHIFY